MHEYAYCGYISSLSVGEMREHPIVGLVGWGTFLFLKPCSFGEQPDINGRHTTTKKETRGWSVYRSLLNTRKKSKSIAQSG